MQDGFGNYCLQYVLELEQLEPSKKILRKLTGHFPELSQQKFSSNVVERCLKLKDSEYFEFKEIIVREIISAPSLSRLLQVTIHTIYHINISIAIRENSSSLLSALRLTLPSMLTPRMHRACPSYASD